MPAFFGYDISNWPGQGLPDLDPAGKLVTGTTLLAQAVLNRCFCDPGSYLQHPDFGVNVLSYLWADTSLITPAVIQQQITKQLLKDTRIDSVGVVVTLIEGSLTIKINVIPVEAGNFSLTLVQAASAPNYDIYFKEAA